MNNLILTRRVKEAVVIYKDGEFVCEVIVTNLGLKQCKLGFVCDKKQNKCKHQLCNALEDCPKGFLCTKKKINDKRKGGNKNSPKIKRFPLTEEIKVIETRNEPTWLPPQPFLNLGVKTRLIYERLRASKDI